MRLDTRLVHAGGGPDPLTGAVNPPVYLSSTFEQLTPERNRGFVYSRTANPTRSALEAALSDVESGRRALAFSSGLGALATLLEDLPTGSRIVAGDDLYGGSWRLFEHRRRQFGLEVTYVDTTRPEAFGAALDSGPAALVYVETPTNPLMRLTDLRSVVRLARKARVRVAVDNTFATPVFQRPLELGADLVLHSTTKYLSGHSDIIGGALVVKSPAWARRLAWLSNAVGAVPSPVDSFLVLRGMRSLGVRMRAHDRNGRAVAAALERNPKVGAVHYPGLESHPQHRLAARQMDGFGGMVSAELRGGRPAARRFLRALRIFTLAESLGGVESLVEHPASMTHASMPRAEREARGLSEGLVRLSCGIEDSRDLVADVTSALGRV